MTKKCVVLDLDNTLWGGIIGEDGVKGIELGLSGRGASFLAFQQALLDLYDKGIILAINSRNNPNDAMAVLREHPNQILKEKHFAASRINWQDKATNINELAKELNISTDSMVFLDDDPTNRALVREVLPEVIVPDLPYEPAEMVPFLLSLPYFNTAVVTDEDKMRGNLYVTERLRREMEKRFTDKEEFLKNLNLQLHIHTNDRNAIPRLSQLTEKTNQFNFYKDPLSEKVMGRLMADPDYLVIHGRTIDKFGDHGITNLAIIKKGLDHWDILQYIMSCRIIGKGIEEAFTHTIAELAKEDRVNELNFIFKKTEKNIPAEEFLMRLGGNTRVDVSAIPKQSTVKILIK